jgi:hypothetical protein
MEMQHGDEHTIKIHRIPNGVMSSRVYNYDARPNEEEDSIASTAATQRKVSLETGAQRLRFGTTANREREDGVTAEQTDGRMSKASLTSLAGTNTIAAHQVRIETLETKR